MRFIVSSAAVLALAACSTETVEVAAPSFDTNAIVNGESYSSTRRPQAMALLGDFGGFVAPFCSATLIAPDVVMTAAHCVEAIDRDVLPSGGSVFVSGASDVTSGALPGDAVEASDWLMHPAWSLDTNPTPDVGLVFLQESVTGVAPAAVLRTSEDEHLRSGQEIELVGWGLLTPGGNDSGFKFGADVLLQVVTPQLLIYGTPLDGETTINKCNGDSGGPSFLDVDGVVRVIGVASRSDCQTSTLDIRADAFVTFFDNEMTQRCNDGSRVACDIPGLPTASQLGAGTLPAAAPLGDDVRRLPPALEGSLAAAGERVGACFGFEADEGVGFFYIYGFGLGAAACTADDVAAGDAYYSCLATADCNDIGNGVACSSEQSQVESALACTDLGGVEVPTDLVDDMDPPLRDGVDDYCTAIQDCGLTNISLGECEAAMANDLSEYITLDCGGVETILGSWLTCVSGASCSDLANSQDPGGCGANIPETAFDDAIAVCDGAAEGEGEGEAGEGEGEAGEGEGEGDDDDDDDSDDDDDDDRGPFGCTSTNGTNGNASAASLWAFALLAVALRTRRTTP